MNKTWNPCSSHATETHMKNSQSRRSFHDSCTTDMGVDHHSSLASHGTTYMMRTTQKTNNLIMGYCKVEWHG